MKKNRYALIFIVMICVVSGGCTLSSTPKGKESFPYDLMVNLNDLTTQFTYADSGFPSVDNAFSYEIKYKNRNDEAGAILDHRITIYADSKSARNNYSTWVSTWFNEYWSQPPELIYKPKNPDDLYNLACIDETINGVPTKSCELLQLHNNLIILVLSNISEKNISFSTFDSILQKLDSRLPASDIPMPSE